MILKENLWHNVMQIVLKLVNVCWQYIVGMPLKGKIALAIYIVIVVTLIFDAKRKSVETFIWHPRKKDYKDLKIYCLQTIGVNEYVLLIKSKHNLYHIKIYEGLVIKGRRIIAENKKTTELIKILTPGEGLMLDLAIPEGMPQVKITFENEAYMKSELIIHYDGRVGNEVEVCTYRLTLKSILYFATLGLVRYREK